jgi:hypothetical protein
MNNVYVYIKNTGGRWAGGRAGGGRADERADGRACRQTSRLAHKSNILVLCRFGEPETNNVCLCSIHNVYVY